MLKQTIRNSIIGGIVFSRTVMIFGLSYAAWTTLSTESDGQTLTAAKWNAVIDRLNSIDQKQLATAWVNFDGSSCTGGAGNECVIKSSYNVSKIVRDAVGSYSVYFITPMDNANYSVLGTVVGTVHVSYAGLITSAGVANTTTFTKLQARNYNGTMYDFNSISLAINGGKN